MAKLMFKFIKGITPATLRDLFQSNEDIHSYNTRHRDQLRLQRGRTTMVHRTFRYKGAIIWNNLSNKVNHECTFTTYKYRVKQYLSNDL